MHVDSELIDSAAWLVAAEVSNGLPVEDEVKWRGWDAEEAETLHALLDELSHADLCEALRRAAARLPEPGDEDASEDTDA